MRKHLKQLGIALTMTLLAGCATRNVIVINTEDDIVRLDKPVNAEVSTTKDGVTWKHAGKMTIPAGWYATPGPGD